MMNDIDNNIKGRNSQGRAQLCYVTNIYTMQYMQYMPLQDDAGVLI